MHIGQYLLTYGALLTPQSFLAPRFACRLFRLSQDRASLLSAISSLKAANASSLKLQKESADARDAAMGKIFKLKAEGEENFQRALAAEEKCKQLQGLQAKAGKVAVAKMEEEMKVLKEDREEAGEELKQAMTEVERLRALAEKSELTSAAAVEKVRMCEERAGC